MHATLRSPSFTPSHSASTVNARVQNIDFTTGLNMDDNYHISHSLNVAKLKFCCDGNT